MNQAELIAQISEKYAIAPDYPWAKYPDYAVFRHAGNRKWFALAMNVPAHLLGFAEDDALLDIVNVKTRPETAGSLRTINGILPAYHMNKEHWVSIVIDRVPNDLLWQLLDDSFALTAK